VAAFHAQQAAEKSMKALLTFHGVDFEKSHNLDELGRKCVSIHAALQAATSAVAPISGYAVETRYPGDWDEPDEGEALSALRVARDLYNAILALLPPEANP
jgi:HEPN domain-containing protein